MPKKSHTKRAAKALLKWSVNKRLKLKKKTRRVGQRLDAAIARGDEAAAVEEGVRFVELLNKQHRLGVVKPTKLSWGRFAG